MYSERFHGRKREIDNKRCMEVDIQHPIKFVDSRDLLS